MQCADSSEVLQFLGAKAWQSSNIFACMHSNWRKVLHVHDRRTLPDGISQHTTTNSRTWFEVTRGQQFNHFRPDWLQNFVGSGQVFLRRLNASGHKFRLGFPCRLRFCVCTLNGRNPQRNVGFVFRHCWLLGIPLQIAQTFPGMVVCWNMDVQRRYSIDKLVTYIFNYTAVGDRL